MRPNFLPFLPVLLLGLAGVSLAQTQQPQVVNRAFSSGGNIRLTLEAGDYQIRPGKEEKIHVEWTAKESKLDKVKVDLTSNGDSATLRVKTPDNGNVKVIIEVPMKANLIVRLTAGDLTVGDVEGDKDIQSHVGDLKIDVGDPAAYGPVEASVNIGDLHGEAFNVSKDGFHNRFETNRGGKYRLHAHVGVGDLTLIKSRDPV